MIRKIIKKDLPDIIQLLRQLWPDNPINTEKMATLLEQYLTNDNYEMYCYEDERILGIITISKRYAFFYGGNAAIIEDLIVDEGYQGKGIGRKLVGFTEKEMAKKGIKAIELTSDLHRTGSHKFWERLGYTKSAFQFRKNLVD